MYPATTIYIVFNGHNSDDTEEYQVYTDPARIPEHSEVHIYSRTGKGKIEPRKFVQEGK
jgi:hypothetical protein